MSVFDFLKDTGENLHHAYLVETEALPKEIFSHLETHLKFSAQGNPDLHAETFDVLSIDEARRIRDLHTTKPLVHDKRIFVLSVRSATVEAQNALLKMIEEPSASSHFFILTPSALMFLPTVRSRVEIIRGTSREDESSVEGSEFLAKTPPDRLIFIEEIVKEKDTASALNILKDLEIAFEEKMREEPQDKKVTQALSEIIKMRQYLNSRSPSVKMVLEHLSLTLPVVKR